MIDTYKETGYAKYPIRVKMINTPRGKKYRARTSIDGRDQIDVITYSHPSLDGVKCPLCNKPFTEFRLEARRNEFEPKESSFPEPLFWWVMKHDTTVGLIDMKTFKVTMLQKDPCQVKIEIFQSDVKPIEEVKK